MSFCKQNYSPGIYLFLSNGKGIINATAAFGFYMKSQLRYRAFVYAYLEKNIFSGIQF